jgi:hypothetical protein
LIAVALIAGMIGCGPVARYNLTVSSTEGGKVVSPGEGIFGCLEGRSVILIADSDNGYHFVNWTGDVSTLADVNSTATTITMYGDYSIMTNFEKSIGGGCFIATAAYGTPMADEIQILRDFRDEYLLTDPLGKGLVDVYYRVSPPIAGFITKHPALKPVVRAGLLPAVALSALAVNTSPVEKIAVVGLLAMVSVAVAIWLTRRRGRVDSMHKGEIGN